MENSMNIALCDDDNNYLINVKNRIKEHPKYSAMNLYLFQSATELYKKCMNTSFDVIFLDIRMPELDGFTLAKNLKQIAPNTLIIFLTDTMEYTVQGYEVAFRYIPKSRLSDMLLPALDAAIDHKNCSIFQFKYQKNTYNILNRDIVYFEVRNHITYLYTVTDIYELREPISSVFHRLSHSMFAMPHRSYIINFLFIKNLESSKITLNNGITIPISRRYSDEFTRQYYHFTRR